MFFIFCYWIIIPIFWLIIPIIAIFNSKIRHHLLNGKASVNSAKYKIDEYSKTKKVIHFHAASSGEFEQLKPILKRLDRKKFFILVSFFSPTVFNPEKNTPLADAVCYHPFDFPWSAWYFFKKLSIKYYIITRNDIWPSHLFIAKKLKIKTVLINANLYRRSHYTNFLYRSIYKSIFNHLNLILTGSDRLRNNLIKLISTDRVVITGDSRLDRVLDRKEKNLAPLLPDTYINSKTLILGSIVPSDYQIIFNGIRKYYNNDFNNLKEKKHRIIIVPHEINSYGLKQIEDNLSKINFEYTYFSDKEKLYNSYILIVDQVGILADLYKYSNVAYVGAGFGSGVHSVIEPAIYNNAISFGPNFQIVDMAVSLINNNLASVIHNSNDFELFYSIIENDNNLDKIRNDINNYIIKQPVASEKILNAIIND